MGFFGLSSEGKKAKSNLTELAQQMKDRAGSSFGRSDEQYGRATDLGNQVERNAEDIYNRGFTPGEARAAGDEAMPGLDERIANIKAAYARGANPSPGQSAEEVGARRANTLGQMKNRTASDYDTMGRNVDTTFGRQSQQNNQVSQAIKDYLGNKYGFMQTAANTGFKAARDVNANVHDTLANAAGKTYSEAVSHVAPGSEARAAANMRAFAPAKAAIMQRLRAAGVDVNSPEAAQQLSGLEESRGHSADAALADAITQRNALNIQKYGEGRNLALDKAGQENELALNQLMNSQGLTREEAQQYINETKRNSGIQTNLDLAHLGQQNEIAGARHAENQNLDAQSMQNELVNRGMSQEDADRYVKGMVSGELTAQDLENVRLQTGIDLTQRNVNTRMGVTNLQAGREQNAYGNAATAEQQGAAENQQSTNQNTGIFQRENANAGWGIKALAGAAGGALNLVAPGAGSILTSAVNGAYGAPAGGPGSFSPMNFQNPFKKTAAAPSGYGQGGYFAGDSGYGYG